ncbi:hypothetical protein OJAV_G00107720 [Oryzias javanicus]|uniref:Uncharacterized protein n=1 Tax=Oryzias javanicus TaxID=123683 RepID=A0A3S2MTI3_ORYJA|nr:hypothetical protein OJAV_G00107720 [Oryzias javanicus]
MAAGWKCHICNPHNVDAEPKESLCIKSCSRVSFSDSAAGFSGDTNTTAAPAVSVRGDWEMVWWTMNWFCFSCCILVGTSFQSQGAMLFPAFSPEQESGDTEGWEWGSGFSPHGIHSFPGDSPFVSESREHAFNCTQRFWLPPAPTCWENAAGQEEFSKCRVLILQNRAALQALSTSSGVEEGGSSYNQKAKEEIQGILSEHQNMEDTVKTMEKVFVSLAEKRKEEEEDKEQ